MKEANTIFITGASSGLGKATARLFQSKGWNVIATMRTPEKEAKINHLPNVFIAKLDVTNVDSIQTAVNEGIQQFGKIDVLVNNAGYGVYGSLESFSREKIFRQFDTNVFGMLEVTKAILTAKNITGIK
jgi:NADP-dependent 3-hydroxy acid dehydrogenase YdfG